MALLLPPRHPSAASLGVARADTGGRRLRIGIVNIMPKLEAYEPSLLAPLAHLPRLVEPVFLRLESHGYQSSDHAHLDRFYTSYEQASARRPLDGLLVSGAPVEELPFEEVHYWRELEELLLDARTQVKRTLGVCWGGLALGKMLGIDKRIFPQKLFGVFEDELLEPAAGGPRSFVCAHSRHSGAVHADLESAARAGTVRLLSRGEQSGYTTFASSDGRFFAHLGHPEYEAERLAYEWLRDRDLGRTDVPPPANFDADAPVTSWRGHRAPGFAPSGPPPRGGARPPGGGAGRHGGGPGRAGEEPLGFEPGLGRQGRAGVAEQDRHDVALGLALPARRGEAPGQCERPGGENRIARDEGQRRARGGRDRGRQAGRVDERPGARMHEFHDRARGAQIAAIGPGRL